MILRYNLRARPINPQLQTNAQVVLHPADFSAEGDLVLAERVGRLLELVAVDFELLA